MAKQQTNVIKNYVELFFEEIKYSKEIEEIKEKIIEKLNEEYDKLLLEDKRNAFKNIVNKYSNLESMLESIGIDKSEIDNWYNVKITSSYEEFKKVFKKERNHIYISTILGIFSFVYMFEAILFFHQTFLFYFIMSMIFLLIDIFVIRKFKNNNSKETYSVDYYEKFERLFDKYTKRSYFWLKFLFLTFFTMLFEFISLTVNSKAYEIAEAFNKTIFTLEVVIFFFVKNVMIQHWLNQKIDFENQ